MRKVLALLAALLSASASIAAPSSAIIDACQYPTDEAARSAWRPMRGSAEVSPAVIDGQRALRLPCIFAGATVARASWDKAVNLDLRSCRGVQFKILCRDASPMTYFSLYFQSGEGWYHGAFFPESASGWNTITIDKAEMSVEGNPAGWGQIKTIRLSAWRGKDVNTEFYLTDLRQAGELGADAVVAVLLSGSTGQRAAELAADRVVQHFQALEIGCAMLNERELTPDLLGRAKLIVLPQNPSLSEATTQTLVRYLERGGKLLAFSTLPERLRSALGITIGKPVPSPTPAGFSTVRFEPGAVPGAPSILRQRPRSINQVQCAAGSAKVLAQWLDDQDRPTNNPAVLGSTNWIFITCPPLSDDPLNQRRMLLALAGSLAPEIWRQAAQANIDRIGRIGGFNSYAEAAGQLARSNPPNAKLSQALASAATAREAALQSFAEQKFPAAFDQASTAGDQVQAALCLAQAPLPGEFRAFWCHSAFGVQGLDWDEAIRRLATNGFTAILPNMLWGGVAFYDSALLPVAPQVSERGDQIRLCVAACRKYGLQVHVWKVNWNLGSAAPKAFVEKMRQAGRLQRNSAGKEEPWLCPSHPDNQQLEIDSMIEVARNYDVDGIHFDYIRYPDAEHCFCPGCRDRFQRSRNSTVKNWPADVLSDGPLRQPWLEWRRGNISRVVQTVSERAHALKPRLKVSAAVFPTWNTDRDGIGQDWKLWCDQRWLDFVCPMDYTTSNYRFDQMVARQVQWAGRVPCYPGIGFSTAPGRFGVDRVIAQITTARRHQTRGFVIFNYGIPESKDLLPLLGMGITRRD